MIVPNRFDEQVYDPLVFDCDREDRYWMRGRRRRAKIIDYEMPILSRVGR